ncbi:MAG TPA: hypothetical protein P5563_10700 [Saprospiraceae bacterium]|nr:hypothetical protein [Saprospiraceae bacterium]
MNTRYIDNGRILQAAAWLLLIFAILFLGSCQKDDNTNPTPNTQSVIKQLSSDESGGALSIEGTTLLVPPQAIPTLANGQAATVSFSIEKGGALPKALPSNMKLVGEPTLFGPEGFIFQEPLWVTFTLPDGTAPDQVCVIGYNNDRNEYGVFPITYYDEDEAVVGAAVYELGHYMLANVSDINRTRAPFGAGGFRVNNVLNYNWYPSSAGTPSWNSHDCYNKLIITNFVPKYPEEMVLWAPYDPNTTNGRRYWEVLTPPDVTGWGPNHNIGLTFMGPQGTYTAQLVVSHKSSQMGPIECKQYSLPLTFTIGDVVHCTSATTCTGWSAGPSLPGGGSFSTINCFEYKPLATIPVCKGDFQSTLTWFNGNGSYGDSDLDLHLYGPDNMHVYWSNKIGPNGITLDRDMIDETGWVQENICAPALSQMPKGEYTIKVRLFDGMDKDFQVRMIRGTQAQSYSGRVTGTDSEKTIFTFTL